MDNNKIIIIGLIVVIVLLLAGLVFIMQESPKDITKLKITSNSTLYEGDTLVAKLTDVNGTPLEDKNVSVMIFDKNNKVVLNESLKTNAKGKVKVDLDLKKGKYEVDISFEGDDKFNSTNMTQKLKIEEIVEEPEPTQSTSSSDNGGYHYSEQAEANIREYTDSNGMNHVEYEDGRSQYYDEDTNTMYFDDGKGNVEAMEW